MNMGIDIHHYSRTITAVYCRNRFTLDIAIFFEHFHCFVKIGSVLEKCASANFVQFILPDLLNVFRVNFIQHTFSLDRGKIGVTETVSINRLFTEILPNINGIAERIKSYFYVNRIHIFQRTLDTMNNTTQPEQFPMIFAAPILAERQEICPIGTEGCGIRPPVH